MPRSTHIELNPKTMALETRSRGCKLEDASISVHSTSKLRRIFGGSSSCNQEAAGILSRPANQLPSNAPTRDKRRELPFSNIRLYMVAILVNEYQIHYSSGPLLQYRRVYKSVLCVVVGVGLN